MTATVTALRTAMGGGREFDRIRLLLESLSRGSAHTLRVGPGDDCAVLAAGANVALTTDLTIEGVHFRREWLQPAEIGYRSAAVALSDLAAVAAEPLGILVSLAVADSVDDSFFSPFAEGVEEACSAVGAYVAGGDLTRSPGPLVVDVVAVGAVEHPLLRSGAAPGDEVWVTGSLGGAAAAVRAWESGTVPGARLREAFAHPRPRIREAQWLARKAPVHALIDLSDGLGGDAGHVAAASGVSILLDGWDIPSHPDLPHGKGDGALELALSGGEDYELCVVVAPGGLEALAGPFLERFGVPLRCVGRVERGSGVTLRRAPDGPVEPLEAAGFDHFRPEASA